MQQTIQRQMIVAGIGTIFVLMPCLSGVYAAPQKQKAAPKTKKVVPPVQKQNNVKGQGQMVGAFGQFGTTYSLKSEHNLTLYAAHYTMDPIADYGGTSANADQKLLVIDFSLKNASSSDNGFNGDGFFTAVDSQGQLYTSGSMALKSQGPKTNLTFKPGQGMGQPGLNDPLRAIVAVPNAARIVKIIINRSRLNTSEEVIRYYVAGATKAEAGEDGDPKNVITPLPANLRDPADPVGAVCLAMGKGVVGSPTYDCTSNFLRFRVDKVVTSTTELVNGNPPEDGKKWVIATVSVTAPLLGGQPSDTKPLGSFYFPSGGAGDAAAEVTDGDGDHYPATDIRKATKDEALPEGKEIRVGEEYTYRVFIPVPKDSTLKTLSIAASGGHRWIFEISDVK